MDLLINRVRMTHRYQKTDIQGESGKASFYRSITF